MSGFPKKDMKNSLTEKFENKSLICPSCFSKNEFLVIKDVECDWGFHTLIQCPKCGDLFAIDMSCNAFQSLENIAKSNHNLITKNEISDYISKGHNCTTHLFDY